MEDPLLWRVFQAGVVPHVAENPGRVRWAGPAVGAHTTEVLHKLLGLDAEAAAAPRHEAVI